MQSKKSIAIAISKRGREFREIENPSRADIYQFGLDITRLGMELREALAAEIST